MKGIQLLVCLLLALVIQTGHADCMAKATTDEEINICQHNKAKELEISLEQLVEEIIAGLPKQQLQRFTAAQEHWQGMLTKDCELEAAFFEGAPIYPAILAQCQQHHFRTRIDHIRRYLCPEHTVVNSCPKAKAWSMKRKEEKQSLVGPAS
jgi:uncharacterized protein YecT (DUF1311 family)